MKDSNNVIEVNNVTMRFNLAKEKVESIKEYFIKAVKHQLMFQEFFALKDVSFDVKRGEVFGIVGLNGSGKSTMLKVICGIYKPYTGSISVNGTIAPLIELGAGFDLELTARENIYLNGYVLGLSRKYLDEKFDEIVDFAELWDFLDVPLKNYSSGMVARIGFAIATITDPEILIADEVLAVGDFLFQEKCEKRINKMKENGATIILVSHSIDQVERMCDRAVWLEKGCVKKVGTAMDVCAQYRQRNDAKHKYNEWVNNISDDALISELNLMADNDALIYDAFYKNLGFGTAGLRGLIGAGSNRMNVYTVGQATQGLSEYLNGTYLSPSVVIAYDSRKNSMVFARCAAEVFAANGIKTYIFEELMPTPILSFAVRKLCCQAGINITASHNPADYNGYKVYDETGCQINNLVAAAVLEAITEVDLFTQIKKVDYDDAVAKGMIGYISQTILESYYNAVMDCRILPTSDVSGISVVYTPLNGTGKKHVCRILSSMGIDSVFVVKEQELPDETFATCPYPNPESGDAMRLGTALLKQTNADLLIATDPDCDRVGVVVSHNGESFPLTGNQIGMLLLYYICGNMTLPVKPVAVKSIVSTDIVDAIASYYGVEMRSVLTGFKYIGEQIARLEQKGQGDRFIFGFEESCGYLNGTYARDKDGVNACMLIVEMAAFYKNQGKTLIDIMDEIYYRFGYYSEVVVTKAFEKAGVEAMHKIMTRIRHHNFNTVACFGVKAVNDYLTSVRVENKVKTRIVLPASDVFSLELEDGSRITIRPSGTEPKLKLYYSIKADDYNEAHEKFNLLDTAIGKFLL